MQRRYLWCLTFLGMPRLVHAANLGPFQEFGAIGEGMRAIAFLVGAVILGFLAVKAFQAYNERADGGMGPVVIYMGLFVMGAIFLGSIVPGLLAPVQALGATL